MIVKKKKQSLTITNSRLSELNLLVDMKSLTVCYVI